MKKLTHLNKEGEAHMVDVSGKEVTSRRAEAEACVRLSEEAYRALKEGNLKKGDALGVARLAGIHAAKQAGFLIPLCHPLQLSGCEVECELLDDEYTVKIRTSVSIDAKTGVEMEALTAASMAALTIYDMCKAVDKGIVIESIRLVKKSGGKSGDWERK